MKKLSNGDIAKMVREEFTRVLAEFDFTPYPGQSEGDDTLSNGLEVTHKQTGMDYTVKSIGIDDVELATPEGDSIVVTKDQLKKDYHIGTSDEKDSKK